MSAKSGVLWENHTRLEDVPEHIKDAAKEDKIFGLVSFNAVCPICSAKVQIWLARLHMNSVTFHLTHGEDINGWSKAYVFHHHAFIALDMQEDPLLSASKGWVDEFVGEYHALPFPSTRMS